MAAIVAVAVGAPFAAGQCPLVSAFPTPVTAIMPGRVNDAVAADLNGDGYPDIAVAGSQVAPNVQYASFPGVVTVMLNRGATGPGMFMAPVIYQMGIQTAATGVIAADLDGDGVVDLAAVGFSVAGGPAVCSVLRGLSAGGVGTGAFSAPNVSVVALVGYPVGLACGDFNGDGMLDLAVADATQVWILDGGGQNGIPNGTFAPPRPAASQPGAGVMGGLVAGDVDGDGILDLAYAAQPGYVFTIEILRGLGAGGVGNGNFAPPTSLVTGQTSQHPQLVIGDFDHDGRPDIATTTASAIEVFLGHAGGMVGQGVPPVADVIATSPALTYGGGAGIADLDCDGVADFVGLSNGQALPLNNVYLWPGALLAAPTSTPAAQVPTGNAAAVGLRVADFNGDGRPDLVVYHTGGILYAPIFQGQATVMLNACTTPPPETVQFVGPNVGGTFANGSVMPITWTTSTGVIGVDIDVSRDGGGHWQRLVTGVCGSTYNWHVTGPATTHAIVRVTDTLVLSRHSQSAVPITLTGGYAGGVVNVGPGSTWTVPPVLTMSAWQLGQTGVLQLTSAFQNLPGYLYFANASTGAQYPIGPTAPVWLDLASTQLLTGFGTDVTGHWNLPIYIPDDPALLPHVFAVQALVFTPGVGPGFAVSNCITIQPAY